MATSVKTTSPTRKSQVQMSSEGNSIRYLQEMSLIFTNFYFLFLLSPHLSIPVFFHSSILSSKEKTKRKTKHTIPNGNDFLNMTPKVHTTKAKTDKLDYIKRKIFCTLKDKTNRVKVNTQSEKIFANHGSKGTT